MAKKGERLSSKTKQRIIESKKGKKLSDTHKEKIRKSLLGNKRCLGKRWIVPQRRNPYKLEKYQIRKSVEYRNWRTLVFERDDYICQLCKKRSGNLIADYYPKTFSTILLVNKVKTLEEARKCLELWDINFGRTLCTSCHYKTETFGWGAYRINKAIIKSIQ